MNFLIVNCYFNKLLLYLEYVLNTIRFLKKIMIQLIVKIGHIQLRLQVKHFLILENNLACKLAWDKFENSIF